MTYSTARDYALELIDQYSVAGRKIPSSYNNQADALHRIPRLLDDAALQAATGRCRIRAEAELSDLPCTARGGRDYYALPEDFWLPAGGGLLTPEGEIPYRLVGDNTLVLPRGRGGDATLTYFRLPKLLGEDPADDAPLDNTEAVQMALPFYAAAHLCLLENPYAYAALANTFTARLDACALALYCRCGTVEDRYGGGCALCP